MKPISMGDVRLAAGEGQLSAHDVLAAVNGILASRRRSLTAALSCPDGFRLVPVEPDLGMYRALTARLRETDAGKDFAIKWSLGSFREDYQAMLAVSPAPAPQPISQDQDRG